MRTQTTVRLVVLIGAAMAIFAFGLAAAPAGAQENDATPLQPGESAEGDIQSFDQWDVYSFEAEAGETVEFEMSRTGGTGDLLLILVDPGGGELTWDFVGPDEMVTLSAVPDETGTHYALVAGNTEDAMGLYALTLLDEAPDEEPVEDEIETPIEEPTEIPEEELRALQPGETLDDELEGADDSGIFALNAAAGDPITVEFERGDGSGLFGAAVADPDGELLAFDLVEAGETLTLAANTTQNGTHFVVVVGATEDAAGPYSITLLEEEPRDIPEERTPDEIIGETMTDAVPMLAPGMTVDGDIGGLDEYDLSTIDAVENESIGTEVERFDGNGTFAAGIVSPDRDVLAADLVDPDGYVNLSATAPRDGTYFVLVAGANEEADGPYSITLLEEDIIEVPPEPPEIPDEEIRELQPGETLDGEIDGIDDFDGFVLTASAGETVAIELVRDGGSGVFGVGIVDIDGDLLTLDFVDPDETISLSATAEADGQYIVVVVGGTADASGAYSLTLLEDGISDDEDGELPDGEEIPDPGDAISVSIG